MGLAQKYIECVNSVFGNANLWNDLSFSLYAVLSASTWLQLQMSE